MTYVLATQTWWQGLLMLLYHIFVDFALPLLVTIFLIYLNKWLKIKLTENQKKKVDEYVHKAILYAEQRLKKALHEGEEPEDKNAARMQWAKEFLEQALINSGLLKMAEAKLEDLIEAKLGEKNENKDFWAKSKVPSVLVGAATASGKEDTSEPSK